MRLLVCAFICVSICGGCSTLDKEQCKDGSWNHVGYVDGLRGRSDKYFSYHTESCPGYSIDENAYQEGRVRGLREYCIPSKGYQIGAAGQLYEGVCEGHNEELFEEQFARGRKVYLLKQRKKELDQEIESQRTRIDKDKSVLNHAVQAINMLNGTSPTESLDKEKSKVSEKIYELESKKPISSGQSRLLVDQGNQNAMLNSAGAITGTLIGFGLGHAIQGRYSTAGWKWTLGEAAWLGVMTATYSNHCTSRALPSGELQSECENSLYDISLLAFLGLRVWQSVDLWTNLSGSEYKTSYRLLVSPSGIGIAGTF